MAKIPWKSKAEMDALFAPFLNANRLTTIDEIGPAEGCYITKPWGDASVAIDIPRDAAGLADALNKVVLPRRFSAIWHSDTKDFEVIWTAFKLRRFK
jgi:hypothetical protein